MTNTSSPRTFSSMTTKTSLSAKRRTWALVSGSVQILAMASARARLELPASSFIDRVVFVSPMAPSPRSSYDALVTGF